MYMETLSSFNGDFKNKQCVQTNKGQFMTLNNILKHGLKDLQKLWIT